MHTPKLMRGLTTLVVVALVGLLSAQPATAKPAPGPGPSSASVTANGVASSFTCAMTFSPEPQYSGTNKVIHYGVRGDCDKPVDLMFQGWLYTVVGTGDNTRYVLEDSFAPRYATAQNWGTGKQLACLGTASNRWVAKGYGTANGFLFTPTYIWSSVYTFPCE